MWDNPRLLNAAANSLIVLALLLFAYAGLQLLLRSPLFPLQEIVLRSQLQRVAAAEIESALEGVGGNFFAADLATVRERLEQVSWVRRVDLQRVWPDRIEVKLEEHIAFARWGQAVGVDPSRSLVNTFGEPFAAPMDEGSAAKLPLLVGPAGSAAELARRYRRFGELLAPLGEIPDRVVVAVVLTPRHAWQLRLAGGLNLELGRDAAESVEQRLRRFIAAHPESLARLPRRAANEDRYVDLRYPNGFALRVAGWKS